jgi:hypothetical protein
VEWNAYRDRHDRKYTYLKHVNPEGGKCLQFKLQNYPEQKFRTSDQKLFGTEYA